MLGMAVDVLSPPAACMTPSNTRKEFSEQLRIDFSVSYRQNVWCLQQNLTSSYSRQP